MTNSNPTIAGRAADTLEDAGSIIAFRSLYYGAPERSFSATAALWSAWLAARHGIEIRLDPADVGAMMALLKMARLSHDPTHRDSALDAAAYATLANACAEAPASRAR